MDYKYEVAFSLEKESAEIGRQINNKIKNKFKTFIYFENKTETAAQSGLDIFYNIFNNQSRIVVILFDEKWGKTDWTRKEEIAIQERILKSDWDFVIIVKLKKKAIIPKWYPKPDIYIDYEEYGVKGVASVIESKVREQGGKIKNETLEEKAKRIEDEKSNLFKIKQTKEKENEGIKLAEIEIQNLFELSKTKIKNLKSIVKTFHLNITKVSNEYIQIRIGLYILNIHWWPRSNNFLDGSHLDFNLMKQNIEKYRYTEHFDDLSTTSYLFDIDPSWVYGWREDKVIGKFYTSEQLIDFWLEKILNFFEVKN